MPRVTADANTLPGDSEERADAAHAIASTTHNVEDHITDWGDYTDDHSAADLRYANAESDGHTATADEVERYYDSCSSEDITPLK